jgi:cytochrome c oxidase cbb3-type subunit 3
MKAVFTYIAMLGLLYSPILSAEHATSQGAHLYQQICSACHGSKGEGGVGVPLALPDFQASVSDDYLAKTIRHGRPGRVMPAFKNLSDQEVRNIVAHIRGFAEVKAPKVNLAHIKGDPKKGKAVYEQRCAACHGVHGEGGRGTGVTFSRPRNQPIIAPALNNPGFLAAASDEMIKRSLANGRKGTPMISFLEQGLSENDLDNVVSYVRQFEKQARPPVTVADEATIVYESPYSVKETVESIKRAVLGKNFRLIRVQNFDDGYVAKDKQNPDKSIVYFCNFKFLNDALAIDPRVGMFLPCRITVVKNKDKVLVMAINPLRLSKLFNNSELDKACHEMRNLYTEILEEATL